MLNYILSTLKKSPKSLNISKNSTGVGFIFCQDFFSGFKFRTVAILHTKRNEENSKLSNFVQIQFMGSSQATCSTRAEKKKQEFAGLVFAIQAAKFDRSAS